MQPYEYAIMRRYEDEYWWYAGFRRILALTFKQFRTAPRILLDAGCGTGGTLSYLSDQLKQSEIFALDIHPTAVDLTNSRKTRAALLRASINQIPFQKNTFDAITSFDVVCLHGVDDLSAFQEFYRALKPGGIFLINLPAHELLRGEHDRAVHIRHRYTARELIQKLRLAGFEVKRITYWNFLLLPLLFLWRKLSALRTRGHFKSDFRPLPVWINESLKFILRIEETLISFLNLPFGTSVFAVAQKPAQLP